jgi:uncharacterized protein
MSNKVPNAAHLRCLVLGYSCIVLGIMGLFLPFLQGLVFILFGLVLLKDHTAWARKVVDLFRERFPRYKKVSINLEKRLDSFLAKIGLG